MIICYIELMHHCYTIIHLMYALFYCYFMYVLHNPNQCQHHQIYWYYSVKNQIIFFIRTSRQCFSPRSTKIFLFLHAFSKIKYKWQPCVKLSDTTNECVYVVCAEWKSHWSFWLHVEIKLKSYSGKVLIHREI